MSLAPLAGCNVVESVEKYLMRKEHAEAQREQAQAREKAEAEGRDLRAEGDGFSVPVPEGFTQVVHQETLAALGEGGLGFIRDGSAQGGRVATSIFIAREPVQGVPVPDTDVECVAVAKNAMAHMDEQEGLESVLVSTEFIDIKDAQRCRYTVKVDSKDYVSTSTLMSVGSEIWWFTCNRDSRDTTAMAICDEMLGEWRNDAIAPEVFVLEYKALVERVCACESMECAVKASRKIFRWLEDRSDAAAEIDSDQAKDVEDTGVKMTECMTALATRGI